MERLIAYLRENMILDFQGDLSVEMLRDFLRDDDSPSARALLAKVRDERGVNDMLIVVADVLLEEVQRSLSDPAIRDQLETFAES